MTDVMFLIDFVTVVIDNVTIDFMLAKLTTDSSSLVADI